MADEIVSRTIWRYAEIAEGNVNLLSASTGVDFTMRGEPTAPPPGKIRVYADINFSKLRMKLPDGTVIDFGSVPHNLLYSAQHPDTITTSVARGMVIVGQQVGDEVKWGGLPLGEQGKVLKSDGSDVVWGSVQWDEIEGRPAGFPPADHTHPLSQLEQSGAQTGQVAKWDGNQWSPAFVDWDEIANKPTSFTPSVHGREAHGYDFVPNVPPNTPQEGDLWYDSNENQKRLRYKDHESVRTINDWNDIFNKPTAFPPADHTHPISQLERSNAQTGQVPKWTGSVWEASFVDWSEIANKPATFPPSAHTHDASDVTSGRLSLSRLPTSSTANKFLVVRAADADPIYDTLSVTDLPAHTHPLSNLERSNAQTGQVPKWSGSAWEAAFVNWDEIAGKPSSFPPEPHTHNASDITSGRLSFSRLPTSSVANKVLVVRVAGGDPVYDSLVAADLPAHTHPVSQLEQGNAQLGQVVKWTGSTWSPAFVDWTEIANKPATFPPSAHTHDASDVTSGRLSASRLPTTVTPNRFLVVRTSLGDPIYDSIQVSDLPAHTHPLTQIEQSGAQIGHVPKWTGSQWSPAFVSWTEIANKPTQFPPEPHFHNASDINAGRLSLSRLPTSTDANKFLVVRAAGGDPTYDYIQATDLPTHTHPLSQLQQNGAQVGQVVKWYGGQWTPAFVDWNEIANKPTQFPPEPHTHLKAHITDLETITTTPTANAVPKAYSTGKIDVGWIPSGVDAGKLQGRNIATDAPNDNDVLTWDATNQVWKPAPISNIPSHYLLDSSSHADTITTTVGRGMLVVGQQVGGGIKWGGLPLGSAGMFLKSDGTDALWSNVDWNDIANKPASYPPSAHTHPLSQLQQSGATLGQVAKWDGSQWSPAFVSWTEIANKPSQYPPSQHDRSAHTYSLLPNIAPATPQEGDIWYDSAEGQKKLRYKDSVAVRTVNDWNDIFNKPASYPPSAHTHPLTDITQSGAQIGQYPRWSGEKWCPAFVDWSEIVNKPATFPPSAHTHSASDITSGRLTLSRLPTSDVANRVLVVRTAGADPVYDTLVASDLPTHSHSLSDLTQSGAQVGQIPKWSGTLWQPSNVYWNEILDKPATFPPSAHTHTLSDILQSGAQLGQIPKWTGTTWTPSNIYWDEVQNKPASYPPSAHGREAHNYNLLPNVPPATPQEGDIWYDSSLGQKKLRYKDDSAVRTVNDWNDIFNKPASYPPSAHTHSLADITQSGAQAGQVAKWTGSQWQPSYVAWDEVANKPTQFPPEPHTHLKAHITDLETITTTPTANAVPKAYSTGKIDIGWIPAGTDAAKLQGRDVSAAIPSDKDVLTWDATNQVWKPATVTHTLLDGSVHTDTASVAVGRGMLIVGQQHGDSVKWGGLPLGAQGKVLKSVSGDALWDFIDWNEIVNKPTSFTPSTHGREAHGYNLIPNIAPVSPQEGDLWYDSAEGQKRLRYKDNVAVRTVNDWNDIFNKPADYPPSAHTHSLSDLTQSGAQTNQVAKWTGTAWSPAFVDWGEITGKPASYPPSVHGREAHGYDLLPNTAPATPQEGYIWYDSAAGQKKLRYRDDSATRTVNDWNDIFNKPATFPPSAHTHPLSDLEQSGAQTNQVAKWTGSAWSPAFVDWSEITNKPAQFPPEPHTHDASDITSGRLSMSRMPTSSTANRFLVVRTADEDPVYDTLQVTDLPAHTHPLSQIEQSGAQTGHVPKWTGSQWSPAFVDWTEITNKPTQFPPEPHTHDASDITSGRLSMSRMPTSPYANRILMVRSANSDPVYDTLQVTDLPAHTHPLSQLEQSGAQTGQFIKWTGTAWTPAFITWNDIQGKPAQYPPEPHGESHLLYGSDPICSIYPSPGIIPVAHPDDGHLMPHWLHPRLRFTTVGLVIGNGVNVITPGKKGAVYIQFGGICKYWVILSMDKYPPTSGSIEFAVYYTYITEYPQLVYRADHQNQIARMVNNVKSSGEANLWGNVEEGGILVFEVVSVTNLTRVGLFIVYERFYDV